MANRSKKTVLSARIEPYLKDGLELYARLRGKKIVEALEETLEEVQQGFRVRNPFRADGNTFETKVALSTLIAWIWSDEPILYRLRLGFMGSEYCDAETFLIATEVMGNERFRGVNDIFDSTKKQTRHFGFEFDVIYPKVNIGRVLEEWKHLEEYAQFAIRSRPAMVQYDDYLTIARRNDPNVPS